MILRAILDTAALFLVALASYGLGRLDGAEQARRVTRGEP